MKRKRESSTGSERSDIEGNLEGEAETLIAGISDEHDAKSMDDSAEDGSTEDGSDQEEENDEGEDDDENEDQDPLLWRKIKSGLQTSLDGLSTAMSFASSGLCPVVENPGLHIAGVGSVGLPLSERDARLILAVSHPALYGKGSDTIVDTTVRRTQELDVDQFEIRNPKWKSVTQAVLKRVRTELKVRDGDITATPYKLLLYEKGAMFKEHREYVPRWVLILGT